MLKLPIGWAAAPLSIPRAKAKTSPASPLARMSRALGPAALGGHRLEDPAGLGGVPWMEVGVRLKRLAEVLRGSVGLAQRLLDHSRVIEEPGIPGTEPERLGH